MSRGSHISLFSGVGMTDIAAERLGFTTIATAEIDPFCRRVLTTRFPDAWHFNDVRQVRSEHFKTTGPLGIKRPLLVSGGFPCQDVSSAGTALGLAGARSGLWVEFLRVIKEFRPEYALIENSTLLRTRGLARILHDLAGIGYNAKWDCIPAAAVGAPHLRDRIFIVATPFGGWNTQILHEFDCGRAGHLYDGCVYEQTPQWPTRGLRKLTSYPTPTKSDGSGGPGVTPKRTGGKNLRTVVAELEGNGRLNPAWVEWLMGLPMGWTNPDMPNAALQRHSGWWVEPQIPRTVEERVKDRGARIRALGNGLVHECAYTALTTLGGITP